LTVLELIIPEAGLALTTMNSVTASNSGLGEHTHRNKKAKHGMLDTKSGQLIQKRTTYSPLWFHIFSNTHIMELCRKECPR
jgi:hypothetical protein